MTQDFTHWDDNGRSRMVDITAKEPTVRRAWAAAFLRMAPDVIRHLQTRTLPKGEPLEVARVAGIMAAKRTAELIPLCHPLALTFADVQLEVTPAGIEIRSEVACREGTGVEMEALTAATVAGLTLYDMAKAMDKSMTLENIRLLEKEGGRSGHYRREDKDSVDRAPGT
ncbi:MAG: cyclic pyranopterin monophosphate synthase MoaC [Acidobacteria bacterium]|nr:cyclic pyranopterin monophosphate synthase MoaC [Acidobacteriota bacterium]